MLPETVSRRKRPLESPTNTIGLFVYFLERARHTQTWPGTIWIGPRFKELLRDILTEKYSAMIFHYIHRPTATDPVLRRMGATVSTSCAPFQPLGRN